MACALLQNCLETCIFISSVHISQITFTIDEKGCLWSLRYFPRMERERRYLLVVVELFSLLDDI